MGDALFFVVDFGLGDNLLATVKTVRRYTMPQMRFSGCRINRHRRFFQFVMYASHATSRRCSATFLNSHCNLQFTTALLRCHSIHH